MLIFTKAYISYRIVLESWSMFHFSDSDPGSKRLLNFSFLDLDRFLLCRKCSPGVRHQDFKETVSDMYASGFNVRQRNGKEWKHKKTQRKSDSLSTTSYQNTSLMFVLGQLGSSADLVESTDFNMFTSQNFRIHLWKHENF